MGCSTVRLVVSMDPVPAPTTSAPCSRKVKVKAASALRGASSAVPAASRAARAKVLVGCKGQCSGLAMASSESPLTPPCIPQQETRLSEDMFMINALCGRHRDRRARL